MRDEREMRENWSTCAFFHCVWSVVTHKEGGIEKLFCVSIMIINDMPSKAERRDKTDKEDERNLKWGHHHGGGTTSDVCE